MKKLAILLAMTLVFIAGCTNDKVTDENSLINSDGPQSEAAANAALPETSTGESLDESDTGDGNSADDPAISNLDLPKLLEDALNLKNSIDIKATSAQVDTITLEPEKQGWEPRIVQEYLVNDNIIKLTTTEPTDSGEMSGMTAFYYDKGELFFVESPFANYVFSAGKLVIWTDENMNILDMSAQDLKRRDKALVSYLVSYLEMFSIGDK